MLLRILKKIGKIILRKMGYILIRIPKEKVYVGAMPLKKQHIQNCKFLEDRFRLLEYLPKHSICAEIGILWGDFSEKILAIVNPQELHLIELGANFIENAKGKFSDKINKQVFLHQGNSFDELMKFDNKYFDWIYIDANHSYEFVQKDLRQGRLKVKDSGLIILDDYIFYDHIQDMKYGVVEAVNEFCNKYDYEIIYYAFEQQMFNNVVLRKIK